MKQKGFSLVELLMVILIISVISVVIAKIMFQGFRSFSTSEDVSEADWQGFVALERLTTDIHNIRSAAGITTITASALTLTDVSGNTVQYTLSGTSLLRNSQTLATGVSGLTFSYLNSAGSVTATATTVRYIGIALTETQDSLTTSFSTLVGTRGMP